MTTVKFTLAGIEIPPPVDWQNIQVLSRFDNDSVEANTDIEAFRFVNEAAQIIRDHIDAGNIFQGIPFTIELVGNTTGLQVFNGFVNTADGLQFNAINDISAKISKLDSLTDLSRKIEGMTFGLLQDQGYVSSSDYIPVQYLVEREFNAAELAVLSLAVYMLTQTVVSESRAIATEAALVIADATGGATGPIAAVVLAAALLLIRAAFAVAMVITLVKLIDELFDYLYPRERTDYGMTLRRACERVFAYLGYTFSSPITDMDYVYLPSKPEGTPADTIGIPNPADYGYRCIEMVDLCKQMFNAKLRVDEQTKTVELRSLNDPFWLASSSWVKPDVLREEKQYNTSDLVGTRVITFAIDQSDYHTIDRYRGTAYEITTKLVTEPANRDLIGISGLEEVRIPVALGNRKDSLTPLEIGLASAVQAVNVLMSVFGAKNRKNKVLNRIGLLIKGGRYHYLPKVILRNNAGRIPADHRDRLSARYLWDTYLNERSLVANNFQGQGLIVEDEPNPFTLADFLTVSNNKYFTLADGRIGEMTAIKWAFDSDAALLSYKVREVYTTNIEEITIEPS